MKFVATSYSVAVKFNNIAPLHQHFFINTSTNVSNAECELCISIHEKDFCNIVPDINISLKCASKIINGASNKFEPQNHSPFYKKMTQY